MIKHWDVREEWTVSLQGYSVFVMMQCDNDGSESRLNACRQALTQPSMSRLDHGVCALKVCRTGSRRGVRMPLWSDGPKSSRPKPSSHDGQVPHGVRILAGAVLGVISHGIGFPELA